MEISYDVLSQKYAVESQNLVAVGFVDSAGQPTQVYPFHSNENPAGIAEDGTPDGRALAFMANIPKRVVSGE